MFLNIAFLIIYIMRLGVLDSATLKKCGYMKQKQNDLFAVRLRIPCGNVTSEQVIGIGQIARKYGSGYVHITARQGIQIPDVNKSLLDKVTEELEINNTPPGSFGPRVRNIIACPGDRECNHGIIDAYGLGGMIDREFFGEDMPTKIKISVTGCPNSCAKPQDNDLGVMGIFKRVIDIDDCSGCGICAETCPDDAIIMEEDEAIVIQDRCRLCGACAGVCPENRILGRIAYRIFVGGKVGRHPKPGRFLFDVGSQQEVISLFRKLIDWSKNNAAAGERLGDCLDRVGIEQFKQEILSEDMILTA